MDRINRGLFAFASYNAGPARIRQLRKKAEQRGLDPNKWFGNVEMVAAREIGNETVQYLANIYNITSAIHSSPRRWRLATASAAAEMTYARHPFDETDRGARRLWWRRWLRGRGGGAGQGQAG